MAVYGYTKNYKLIKPQFDTDTWHDYEYDNLDTIDAVLSAIFASGDWQGFWKTNTHYDAGGVVIDRDTDTMYEIMVEHTTSEATFALEQTAHPTYYELWSPNTMAQDWAIKMDGVVHYVDYSSKAYAISSDLIDNGSAQEWAIKSGTIGTTGEYSAKKYATDAHNDYISMTTNVNVAAVGSNIANVNAVGQSISDVNTVASDISSVNTVASNINDVNTVAGISAAVSTVATNDANVTTVATNISDVNTAAANMTAIQAAPTAATNAAASATLAQDWATKMDGQVASTDYSSKYYAGQSATSAQAAQEALDELHGLLTIPIGAIYQSIYVDESLGIARQLNGQLISSLIYTGFREWLTPVMTVHPSMFTDEATWQSEFAASKLGQCGKFVVDDENNTIRLPAVVNPQGLLGLSGIGNLVSESLPNITGAINGLCGQNATGDTCGTGVFANAAVYENNNVRGTSAGSLASFPFSASQSSSVYQDSAPVQQEAVQYPYYIQVATGVEETLPAIREYKVNNSDFFGKSMYSDIAPDNASWLVSNGNYNARAVYPDYYDWLVSHIGETITANGGKVVLSTGTITDYDFVVNQNDQTFRLPLLNGEEDLPSSTSTTLATTVSNGDQYVADVNSYIAIACTLASGSRIKITNIDTGEVQGSGAGSNTAIGATVFVRKGERARFNLSGTLSDVNIAKIKAVGNGTLYYYVGDTVQDASLINAGVVLGQLSNKADIDASNFNAVGKSLLAGLSMPSDTGYLVSNSFATSTSFTAPSNGYFRFRAAPTTANTTFMVFLGNIGNKLYSGGSYNGLNTGQAVNCFLPVKKGQSVIAQHGNANLTFDASSGLWFIPAEGEN